MASPHRLAAAATAGPGREEAAVRQTGPVDLLAGGDDPRHLDSLRRLTRSLPGLGDGRRRRAVAVLTVAVLAVGVVLVVGPARAGLGGRPNGSAPPDVPRDVLLVGAGRLARLPTLTGRPRQAAALLGQLRRTMAPGAAERAAGLAAVPPLGDLRQLADGRVAGIVRPGGELVVLTRDTVTGLGRADWYFTALAGGQLWRVERPQGGGGGHLLQRVATDGRPSSPTYRLPLETAPVGEVRNGILVARWRGGIAPNLSDPGLDQVDLAVLDPVTGLVTATLAEQATVADVRSGVVVWYHTACQLLADCLLHLQDTGTGASAVVTSIEGVDTTVRGETARLSPDGRWLSYLQALRAPGGPGGAGEEVFEVAVADTRAGDPVVVPSSQGVAAGMVPGWSGNRLLLRRGRASEATVGAYLPTRHAAYYGHGGLAVAGFDAVGGSLDPRP